MKGWLPSMEKGNVIVINGASSSGKTTVMKCLSKHLPKYFALSLDDFGELLGKATSYDSSIQFFDYAPNIKMTAYLFHRFVADIVNFGGNAIIDTVLFDEDCKNDCRQILGENNIIFVGVHCDIDELRKRELQRKDRKIGLAEQQITHIHQNMIYDVEIDTSKYTMDDCVSKILAHIL